MSHKHYRRLLQEEEEERLRQANFVPNEEHSSEDEVVPVRRVVNRFAAMAESDDESASCEDTAPPSDPVDVKKKSPPAPTQSATNKKKKQKKKKRNAHVQEECDSEKDEDELLNQLIAENSKFCHSEADSCVGVEELFKVNPRLFDYRVELKRRLNLPLKESSSHRQEVAGGRFVKRQTNWPPVRSIGLSMVPVEEDTNDEIKKFRFKHNSVYQNLERMCWMGENSMDISMAQEILQENYYHLNSLLLLANMYLMQEDVTDSFDCIERGIFYCEQMFHSLFQPTSWNHRLDYTDYENRAFFLLLHRQMLNCVHRSCCETALNFAKMVFCKDPQRDPLAILLLIDNIALQARELSWFISFYKTMKEWKKLDLLPNMRYSLALCHFLGAKTDEEKQVADQLLTDAICTFPGVVTQLLDELQIQADPVVESDAHLSSFALNNEPDGLRLVIKIYVKQSLVLWKEPEVLSWVETTTRRAVENAANRPTMLEWQAKRCRVFVGTPQNVRRLAVLLGLESSKNGVTDPEPPANGRAPTFREAAEPSAVGQNPLAGFIHSLLPDFNPEDTLESVLQRALDRVGWPGAGQLREEDLD